MTIKRCSWEKPLVPQIINRQYPSPTSSLASTEREMLEKKISEKRLNDERHRSTFLIHDDRVEDFIIRNYKPRRPEIKVRERQVGENYAKLRKKIHKKKGKNFKDWYFEECVGTVFGKGKTKTDYESLSTPQLLSLHNIMAMESRANPN